MKIMKNRSLAYVYLAIYYILSLAITPPNVFFLSVILISVSLGFVALYWYIKDELLFYAYILFSLFVVIVPFSAMRNIDAMDLAVMYTFMAPLLLHIIAIHFSRYGKATKNTYLVYLSSLPLSLVLAYMVIYLNVAGNAYVIAALIFGVVIIYYLLLKDSVFKSE